jgi:diguanylate cyclase (GGDEF)-like protein
MPADADLGPFLETTGNLLGIAIEHAGMVSHMVDRYNEVLDLKHHLEERNKELADLNYRLSELSVTDSLTGLYNRRYLQERLSQEVDRSVRLGQPLTIIMADLDHFKRINDELGHQQGDEALVRFAGWFRAGVRRVDTVGRYGGEEFLALLVNCNGEDGKRVANKIRINTWKLSAAHPFDVMGGFTVSMGVAQLGPGQDPVTLVARADRALYQAKQEGRNRVSLDKA